MNEERVLTPNGHPETMATADEAIYVRKASMADLEEIVALVERDRANLKHQAWTRDFNRENAPEVFRQNLQVTQAGTFLQYRTVRAEDDRIIGTTSLYDIDRANGTAKMGYWLASDARGNSFAKVAAETVLHYAFTGLGLHKIELEIAPDNTPSEGLAVRLGAELTDVTRVHDTNGTEVEHRVWVIHKDGAE